jgi:hypothetical protein
MAARIEEIEARAEDQLRVAFALDAGNEVIALSPKDERRSLYRGAGCTGGPSAVS